MLQIFAGFVLQIFDYAGPSAYKYLRTWFNVHGLWSKPASYIFPNVVTSSKGKTTQLHFNKCVSKKWYERQLDAMLTAIGEDPKKYSVHSLRAVQNYGRWTSLSALIYFRDSCGIIAYAAARAFETGTFQCTGGN